jgi:iron complex transport system ATP-binding protein
MTALLEASGLAFPGRLRSTGFRVQAPELVCLVGPNGSGKTSLLHALAGVGNPAGRVLIDGSDPTRLPPGARMRLFSYLPASRELVWPIRARDLIALGRPSGVEAAGSDVLGIADLADRRVDRLSTGERSRVLIARALAAEPRLLLLDEPVSNLDPLWQIRLMDHLRSLVRDRERAVVLALHDLDLAVRYAGRLIVMDGGAVAADGDPRAIVTGGIVPRVFGIERGPGGWRPVSPPADPRSSP